MWMKHFPMFLVGSTAHPLHRSSCWVFFFNSGIIRITKGLCLFSILQLHFVFSALGIYYSLQQSWLHLFCQQTLAPASPTILMLLPDISCFALLPHSSLLRWSQGNFSSLIHHLGCPIFNCTALMVTSQSGMSGGIKIQDCRYNIKIIIYFSAVQMQICISETKMLEDELSK